MAEAPPVPDSFITVRSTLPCLPLPLIPERPWVTTERLVLRPLAASDLEAMHELRTQSEVMIWTSAGKPDSSLDETKVKLDYFLSEKGNQKSFNYAICFKEDPSKLIGLGGCHNWSSSLGWPELGYMFRKEAWGQGIATEFLKAWLGMWKALPRQVVEVKCDERTLRGADAVYENKEEGVVVEERLMALTTDDNEKSQNILKKCGFEHFLTWKAREAKPSKDGGEMVWVDLPSFRYFPGRN
ncbi:acyl-CoA N-acyltransferase [Pseudoneurospora amorphoporcata]|uniref:Acyl-CoA N-acyltransferase n=1 Tax=Pseudoneurospora amorphoporcata TaxID=241081 RepID=A0AAN6NY77_9PEZI|nr:acyl-CoA N-acyltransferase [Pseudoneurospora amorphoporcata]